MPHRQTDLEVIDKSILEMRNLLKITENDEEKNKISKIIDKDLEMRRMVLRDKYDELSSEQLEYLELIRRSFG